MKKLKKDSFKKIFSGIKIFKKYNYNIDNVIGVKDNEKYILYTKKKLVRIYHDNLKSSSLLSSYIPIENVILYNFRVEKSVIEKVDLYSFIETKIYAEAGVDETEDYIIKYKIIDKLKDEKYVIIETVIIPTIFLKEKYKYIYSKTGYIDYLSFPAFAYQTLYEEKILKKANDIFIVLLYDKILLTFYSNGELVYMKIIAGGIDKIFDALKIFNIKNFDFSLLQKILIKKGVLSAKYSQQELIILETIKKEFLNISYLVQDEIRYYEETYEVGEIDRIFITSEYGNILNLEKLMKEYMNIECFNFEFYEKYNLDRLNIDPFLFLGMFETHYAYKNNNQLFNFSIFVRKPTFLFRPSGELFSLSVAAVIIAGIYPVYLWVNGNIIKSKNRILNSKISHLNSQIKNMNKTISSLSKKDKNIKKAIKKDEKQIKQVENFIENIYAFKFAYIPKSQELTNITYYLNKNNVYINKIEFSNKVFTVYVFSYKESSIPSLVKNLSNNGFSVNFDKIILDHKQYNSVLRIEE